MAGRGRTAWPWLGATIALALMALVGNDALPARAQSGWWPWSSEPIPQRPPPIKRETAPGWRSQPQPPAGGFASPAGRSSVCLQLEQRLVDDQRRGSQTTNQLPQIETEFRQVDRALRAGEAQLERSDCFDYFLFSKTLRRSRQCVELAGTVDANRRKLAELDAQRRQIMGSRERNLQDDLIRELARNNCGSQYNQEAQRRGGSNPFASLWQDEDTGPTGPGGRGNQFGNLPFATYKTVCVRLCDGFFFPISFSTLENHFERDVSACQSKCAAPVQLYFYQNPGGTMEQARSVVDQMPYTGLKTAFRFRKEYVQGCSCKQTEYTPSPNDQPARRSDAEPALSTPRHAKR